MLMTYRGFTGLRVALGLMLAVLALGCGRPAQAAVPRPFLPSPPPVATPSIGATARATASVGASPSATVEEGPKIRITDVKIRGNKAISDETILLSIPLHAGQEASRAQVMESLQRIYGLGYFQNVTAATEPAFGGDRLIFNVIENPVLQSVEITGATLFPVAELQKPFEAMKGRIINLKDVQAAIRDMEKRYADQGYVLARVVDMQVQPQGKLEIKLAEGVIHAIKITGNEDTQDYVIRREITLKPGMIYNFKRMEDDLRRVYNLNYFEDINIKYEPAPGAPGEVVVIVNVKEKLTGTFQLSAGWSNQDGPLGLLSYKKDNLFGRSQSVSADLTISRNWAMEVNYFNPWIDERHTSLGTGGYVRRYYNYFAGFLEERQGLQLSLGQPLFGEDPVTAQWRHAARVRFERVDLRGGVNYDVPVDIFSGAPIATGSAGQDADMGPSVGYTVTFDSRDYVLNPNTGWFNTYSLDQYVPLGGNLSMTRAMLDVNRYFPLWFGHTLAFGWKLGSSVDLFGHGIPAYERFYSNGAYLIRGWPENPVGGPGTDLDTWQKQGLAFSGDSFTLGSVEYRFPIVSILSGVVFGDSGIFWDQSQNNFNLSRDRSGYGVGVRLNTPLGPLRLDFGLHRWGEAPQIHFSIGQKF